MAFLDTSTHFQSGKGLNRYEQPVIGESELRTELGDLCLTIQRAAGIYMVILDLLKDREDVK